MRERERERERERDAVHLCSPPGIVQQCGINCGREVILKEGSQFCLYLEEGGGEGGRERGREGEKKEERGKGIMCKR